MKATGQGDAWEASHLSPLCEGQSCLLSFPWEGSSCLPSFPLKGSSCLLSCSWVTRQGWQTQTWAASEPQLESENEWAAGDALGADSGAVVQGCL